MLSRLSSFVMPSVPPLFCLQNRLESNFIDPPPFRLSPLYSSFPPSSPKCLLPLVKNVAKWPLMRLFGGELHGGSDGRTSDIYAHNRASCLGGWQRAGLTGRLPGEVCTCVAARTTCTVAHGRNSIWERKKQAPLRVGVNLKHEGLRSAFCGIRASSEFQRVC